MAIGKIGTLINGKRYDSSSVEIQIAPTGTGGAAGVAAKAAIGGAGKIIQGITEISYKDKLEPGKQRSVGSPLVKGRTRGEYEAEAAFAIYKEDFALLVATLSIGGQGFGETEFQIVSTYAEARRPPIVDVVEGCRIMDVSNEIKAGPDIIVIQCSLDVMRIKWNGKYLVTEPGGVAGVVSNLIGG